MIFKAISNAVEYILILLLILDTNTVYSTAANIDFYIPELTAVLLIITVSFRLITMRIKRKTFDKYGLFIILYYILMITLLVLCVSRENILSFSGRFLIILPFLTLYFCNCIQRGRAFEQIRKYVNLMTVIAAISLFFWLFGSMLHLIEPSGAILVGWGSGTSGGIRFPSYYGLYFEHQTADFLNFLGITRNQGIFAEGPMFCLCLALALASELFLPVEGWTKRNPNLTHTRIAKGKVAILAVALFTTITTTGQVILILMGVFRFALSRPQSSFNRIFKGVIWILGATLGLYIAISLFSAKSSSTSWKIRLDDFNAGFAAWLSSPIWGRGYNDLTVLDPFRAAFRNSTGGTSNSIATILAQGGILLFSVYFVPIFSVVKKAFRQENITMLMFVAVLLLEFIFAICAYQSVILFFFAFFYGTMIAEGSRLFFKEGPSLQHWPRGSFCGEKED